jgi:hypothetical protein
MSPVPALILALSFGPLAAAATEAGDSDQVQLDRYLRNLARLSRLYLDNALSFSCEEKIFYHSHYGRKTYRSYYVYRFDEEDGLSDFRLRYRYNPRKKFKPKDVVVLTDYPLPSSLSRAYSWIFVFDPSVAEKFQYGLAGRGEALGRPAVLIQFAGLPPHIEATNDWIGTAWVDAETSQLLRVIAYRPEEHLSKLRLEEAREVQRTSETKVQPTYHSVEEITTDFEVQKNGMRFPSEVRIERRGYPVPGYTRSGTLRYLVRQKYLDYQFFSVRTETEIEAVMAP